MVIDYSERRQSQRVQSRRPQRPSVWPYALIIIAMIIIAFLAGIGTGWHLFRPGGRLNRIQAPQQGGKPVAQPQPQAAPAAASVPQGHGQPPTQPVQPLNSLPPADKGAPVPLTFYNTLQKGNRELMGTGINPPKEGHGAPPKQPSPAQPEH